MIAIDPVYLIINPNCPFPYKVSQTSSNKGKNETTDNNIHTHTSQT